MMKNLEQTTIGTSLMWYNEAEGDFEELVEITGYPDLGGTPEAIEVTTLKDSAARFIPGIETNETLEFTMIYNVEDFTKLKELEGAKNKFAIWFGYKLIGEERVPHGQYGKFTLEGYLLVRVAAGEVNEARTATISIVPSSQITFEREV